MGLTVVMKHFECNTVHYDCHQMVSPWKVLYFSQIFFFSCRDQLWHLFGILFIPAEMNTSDCQHPISRLSALTDVRRSLPLFCSLLFHKLHANCNTCKPLAYMHSLHAHTHTVLPHSDSWSVAPLARHPERRRRGGQEGSSRQRGRGVCFSTFSHGACAKCRLHTN